jgi:glycerophosphoryl diester phosphodiesterase
MQVLNIAHRGARSLAPENTLAAAQKALEIGADLWETDVTVTADGELVLMHDASLARTTDAQQRFPDRAPWTVTTFTLDEIRQLDTGTPFIETDPFGQIAAGMVTPGDLVALMCVRVPTLRQALVFTQQARWRVNLELKRIPPPMEHFPIVERVLTLTEELGIDTGQVIISSFNHDWLRQIQRLNTDIEVQALVGDLTVGAESGFRTCNASAAMVDEEQVRRTVEKGVTVNLYTVNEESDMRRFIQAGAAGLFTDFPQRLKALLSHSP